MQDFDAIHDLIEKPQTVLITTHLNPDADAMGSSLGLAGYLKKKGHHVTVIVPTEYPENLYWLGGNEEVIVFEEKKRVEISQLFEQTDVIFCLDFSAINRIRDLEPLVRQSRAKKVMIDHHLEPESFADYAYWDTKAAATAQLIFQLIDRFGDKNLVDVPMAECLYAGIMTDTGSFRHANTTGDVHRVVAELIDIGIEVSPIHRRIYDNVSVDKLRFTGYALSEKLVVLPEYRFAYITITDAELKRFRSKMGDTEGLVNQALAVEGVIMAAILIDRGDEVKMSFRSVGDFSVRDLASQHFSGGGHKNAAGGRTTLTLKETEEKLLSVLPAYQEQLLETV